jgi:ATPases involved in chromosome partitioning
MKKHVVTTYECEICGRTYPSEALAAKCENYPAPALSKGDVVLWTGRRDDLYGNRQSLVIDHVKSVERMGHSYKPGHPVQYVLEKQIAFEDYNLPDARHGYVNCVGRPARAILHSDQIYSALRDSDDQDLAPIFNALERAGIHFQPHTGELLPEFYDLVYQSTWYSSDNSEYLYRISPGMLPVVRFLTRKPTDQECLEFVGGFDWHKQFSLVNAFQYNNFIRWGALVNYDFRAALDLVSHCSEEEIIARVHKLHEEALAGQAVLPGNGWMALFKFRTDLSGKWPKEVLDWVKQQKVSGSGQTRVHRVYEALDRSKLEPGERIHVKNFRIFPNKQAIAVLAGKGGVGKSTVAANLARALTAAGKKVLVFDADFYGPSQPLFFPVEEERLRTENGLILPHVVDGVEVISFGHLLDKDEALEWRGVYLQAAMHALATNIKSDADTVIFDMPPGTGDILIGLEQMCPQVGFLFVATAGEVALADVRRAINTLDGNSRARILGVVENMAYLDTPNGRIQLWGSEDDVAKAATDYHLRFLGKLPMGTDPQARLAAVKGTLLPATLDFLAGNRYQKVAADVVRVRGQNVITRLNETLGASSGMRTVTDVGNIAEQLEAEIRNLGGNPDDLVYQPILDDLMKQALASKTILAGLNDRFIEKHPEAILGHWWTPYAQKYHPAVFAAAEKAELPLTN